MSNGKKIDWAKWDGWWPKITRQIKFRETVAGLTGMEVEEVCPLTGKITSIMLHYPDGCDALVDIAVGHGEVWLIPTERGEYQAFNDATPVIPIEEPVFWGERLWAMIDNGDALPHTPSITITMVGIEQWPV